MSLSRRKFLHVSAAAGGGMLIGFHMPGCKRRNEPDPTPQTTPATTTDRASEPARDSEINAWIRIATDDTVTIQVDEAEMGQGVLTALPMILVEELGADWSLVRSEHALLDPRYGRQSTGGSTSIRTRYPKLRQIGAAARHMLIAAAAAEWGVPASECTAERSTVSHAKTGKSARYGALAERAATMTPPSEPTLKPEKDFELIGTPAKRLDTRAKINGSAVYGIDVRLPGMLIASVERSPIFGAKVKSWNADAAKKLPGVIDVREIPSGVAVIAEHSWAATQGRKALQVVWDGGAPNLSNEVVLKRCQDIIKSAAAVDVPVGADGADGAGAKPDVANVANVANIDKAMKSAAKTVRATYVVPFLAHAAMEPLGCTAQVHDKDGAKTVELWVSTQSPSSSASVAAEIAGIDLKDPKNAKAVTLHTMMLGGGFGRRSQTDFIADAMHLAVLFPNKPVKVMWTREDDIRAGWYRPFAYNELEAALDKSGAPVAWRHRIASPAILQVFGPLENGIDATSVEGAANLPYSVPDAHVTYANPDIPIPLWFWRSVGSSQNAYVTECFLDELAHAGGRDPFELRRALLGDKPRHKRVLERAAEMAGWGTPLPEGRARGIAVHESFASFVAQVAEVSLENGVPRVHKVFCAVDCGRVINPNTVVAQMESGIMYGLSAALYGRIDLAGGRVTQSNFDTYKVVRMSQAPAVETVIIDSQDAPGGVGEPGLPPIAPALCNALLALTGKPVRTLPVIG